MGRSIARIWPGLALTLLVVALLGAAPCGAENVDAPEPPPVEELGCLAPHELAPAFYGMLAADRFAGLRTVIEESLSACTMNGQPASCNDPRAETPAMGVLLAEVFVTLIDFATDPPEIDPDSGPGDPGYCAPSEDGLARVNRLCIVRRALDRLILERTETGNLVMQQAFLDLGPLIADIFRYIDGGFPQVSGDRYADLPVLRTVVRRCGGDDFVGVVDAFLAWFDPQNAGAALDAILRLLRNPDAERFLDSIDIQSDVGRDGFVALGRLLLDIIRSGSFDPAELDQMMNDLVYPSVASTYPDNGLEGDLRVAMGVLMDILDPARTPSMVQPMQGLLECHAVADPDDVILGMLYDLSVAANSIGLDELVETLQALLDLDPNGSLMGATREIFGDLAEDQDLRDALARTIDILLMEENARLLNPLVVEVLESPVPAEAVAILDAMLGGCQQQVNDP
ncbi:MAG: hypothetical protein P1V51_18135 [Deltaproteobacteria bacterium]|nr:hypothetical protein [Deltaproteobacteria bacterium]